MVWRRSCHPRVMSCKENVSTKTKTQRHAVNSLVPLLANAFVVRSKYKSVWDLALLRWKNRLVLLLLQRQPSASTKMGATSTHYKIALKTALSKTLFSSVVFKRGQDDFLGCDWCEHQASTPRRSASSAMTSETSSVTAPSTASATSCSTRSSMAERSTSSAMAEWSRSSAMFC